MCQGRICLFLFFLAKIGMREQRNTLAAVQKDHEKRRRERRKGLAVSAEKAVEFGKSPEEDVKSHREENYHQTENFGAGRGLHFDDALIFQNDSLTASEVVEKGENRANHHDGD